MMTWDVVGIFLACSMCFLVLALYWRNEAAKAERQQKLFVDVANYRGLLLHQILEENEPVVRGAALQEIGNSYDGRLDMWLDTYGWLGT